MAERPPVPVACAEAATASAATSTITAAARVLRIASIVKWCAGVARRKPEGGGGGWTSKARRVEGVGSREQ